ncbi:MAG: bifunctional riboflavin kinase/FAD synthetase [Qingshengfaniella sp.]
MRIAHHHKSMDPALHGASAAIGNFDGVHRGHRVVIDLARAQGQAIGAPLGVVTFDPHPREFFAPQTPPFRLMNRETREHRLAKLGVERLFALPFDAELAGLSAEAFARDVLARDLGLAHVVVGHDFHFGQGRGGDATDLVRFGKSFGFGVTIADLLVADGSARPISSTRIREALTDGRPGDARAMLGHWHRIDGPVIHGEKRGRTLNYPTANMDTSGLHQPHHGVYAVLADILDGPHAGRHHGVASIGVRPMFGQNTPNLETHIFDFSGDLYGAELSIALVRFLRPEQRFDSVAALVAQMDADSLAARRILADAQL